MITDLGKRHIKRYLAGQVGVIGDRLAFGLSDAGELGTDARLGFEFATSPVELVSYDFINDRLIFKGTMDADFSGKVYEVGLWSQETEAGDYTSKVLLTFNSLSEDWTNATWVTTNARVGADALRHAPAASGSVTSELNDVDFDLSESASADQFVLAYYVGNANTASVNIRFRTDASNYFQMTITSPTAGYKIATVNKGSLTVVGTPAWDNITSVAVTTTATAGGAAAVEFDALRIEDVENDNPDYVLVAREVLGAAYTKTEGSEPDVEFSLAVTL